MTNQVGDTEMADEGPDQGHNLTKTNEAIVNASEAALAKEAQIAAAKAKYIKPLQDDLNQIWRGAKTQTGFPITHMKSIHNLRSFAAKGANIEDDDERHDFQDHMRIAFGALAKGGHLNFLDVDDAMSNSSAAVQPTDAAA